MADVPLNLLELNQTLYNFLVEIEIIVSVVEVYQIRNVELIYSRSEFKIKLKGFCFNCAKLSVRKILKEILPPNMFPSTFVT